MVKRILFVTLMSALTLFAQAQVNVPSAEETPQLEFALQLRVTLDAPYSVGETQHGRRTVIPITGGTFEGPLLKGTIINGGADYQLANAEGRTEIEAIYSIKTDDGVICSGKDAEGRPSFYFKAAPQFEAPANSRYAWLNNAIFVCQPAFNTDFKGIVLNVWKVK